MSKYHQGIFRARNSQKYKGDSSKIVYRSSWELKLFSILDMREDILQWSSEEIIVAYISPKDNRTHRYFPDVVATVKTANGTIKTLMIEIKPASQCLPPIKKSRITKTFINEVMTYAINQEKWKAARLFCEKKGWEFHIFTENELGIK